MARAGCTGINFGVESTDPEIQQGVHRKPILTEECVSKVAICRTNGIATFAFFVVGLPGDTVETILRSIEFAVEMRANWTQFTIATPFAGTPMHDWAVRQGFIAPDFYKIINAHDGSPGNEHLRPRDIVRLHRFARFLQNNLINRYSILKNETRRDLPCRMARRAPILCRRLRTRVGRQYFTRAIVERPPAPRGPDGGTLPLALRRSDSSTTA